MLFAGIQSKTTGFARLPAPSACPTFGIRFYKRFAYPILGE